jgi:MoaA/NifB/PqqE/SkfB family radical SAM enzyme
MTVSDWMRVLDDAAEHGVDTVQFIGGEPTLHPAFSELVAHALAAGLGVEVFTNLYRVTPALWSLFARPGVRLATSYYSDDPARHDAVTGRSGSHARTRENIMEAVRRGIPLRVGVIDMGDSRLVDRAQEELAASGVTDVGRDRVRAFGRGAGGAADEADTCGQCGHGTAAVGPDGRVSPCVFTRHAVVGNVRRTPLGAVLDGAAFRACVSRLDRVRRSRETACSPPDIKCTPKSACVPACTPSCGPMRSPHPMRS